MVTGFSIGIKQNSQSAASNLSNVTVSLTITWNGGSYNATGAAAGVLNIDGTDYSFTAKFNTAQATSGSQVIFSKTLDIAHSSDGSKTLSCSASFATGTAVGTVTASAAKKLTQIPRESTAGATDANIGATAVISVSRKNADYTHSVGYSFGALKGYLADGSGTLSDREVKLKETSLSFPIPESFYGQIPDSPRGLCTLTVRTYSGDVLIGSEKSCSFTVTAPQESCSPEVSGTVIDINEATVALTGDASVLVRGMSTAQCTITAQAKNGATIKSKAIGTQKVEDDTRQIPGIETGIVRFEAKDSRGYNGVFTKEAALVQYVPLTCSAEVARTDPTSGNAMLRVSGNCYNGSFGSQENSLQLTCQVEDAEPIDLQVQTDGNRYWVEAELSGLDYRAAHTVTVTARDKLMTLPKTLILDKGIPVFDWGEQDFNFNVPVYLGYGANGVFMESKYVDGVNKLQIQSQLGRFDGTGKGRQIFFITGNANGLPVCGLVGLWLKDGSTFLHGTGIASASSDNEKGQVNVVFDTTPWDTFAVISNGAFHLI